MQTRFSRLAATLLVFGILHPLLASACDDVRACIEKWGPGRRVEVILITGDQLTGHIGPRAAEGFVLSPDKKGGDSHNLKYGELRDAKTKKTSLQKWLIAGGVYVGVTTILSLIISDR
jgi:hypothetical protein